MSLVNDQLCRVNSKPFEPLRFRSVSRRVSNSCFRATQHCVRVHSGTSVTLHIETSSLVSGTTSTSDRLLPRRRTHNKHCDSDCCLLLSSHCCKFSFVDVPCCTRVCCMCCVRICVLCVAVVVMFVLCDVVVVMGMDKRVHVVSPRLESPSHMH